MGVSLRSPAGSPYSSLSIILPRDPPHLVCPWDVVPEYLFISVFENRESFSKPEGFLRLFRLIGLNCSSRSLAFTNHHFKEVFGDFFTHSDTYRWCPPLKSFRLLKEAGRTRKERRSRAETEREPRTLASICWSSIFQRHHLNVLFNHANYPEVAAFRRH